MATAASFAAVRLSRPLTLGGAGSGNWASVRRRVVALTAPMLIVLLSLGFFLTFFHPEILQTRNISWLLEDTDNGEGALGAHAYWHDAAAGASLHTNLLNAPEGVPVLYTDSNPLLTLLAKPFASLLPADTQLFGWSILLSLLLQTTFAWALLRRLAPGRLALWAGVALLAFPPTLAHRYLHVNLMAHWTILAALCLFLDERRSRHLRWWLPLIAVTTMIHSYLLIMVAAIWGSALLVRFTKGDMPERLATVGQGAAVVATVAVLARWLGVGDQLNTGTFGIFRMPLDALWNPLRRDYATLLPTGTEDRWTEGFQYLGAGGLLLIVVAMLVALRRPAGESELAVTRRLRDLAPALMVLTMLAIAYMPLPPFIVALLDPVRASARLFWPVAYVLVMVAILAVYRLPARRAGLALAAIVVVQAVDMRGMAPAVRAHTAKAPAGIAYDRTPDPRWDALVRRSSSITFMPEDVQAQLEVFQEVAWRAAKLGTPVQNIYAARTSRRSAERYAEARAAFARGDLDPGRLYILLPDTPLPPEARRRLMTIDGVQVVAPLSTR